MRLMAWIYVGLWVRYGRCLLEKRKKVCRMTLQEDDEDLK